MIASRFKQRKNICLFLGKWKLQLSATSKCVLLACGDWLTSGRADGASETPCPWVFSHCWVRWNPISSVVTGNKAVNPQGFPLQKIEVRYHIRGYNNSSPNKSFSFYNCCLFTFWLITQSSPELVRISDHLYKNIINSGQKSRSCCYKHFITECLFVNIGYVMGWQGCSTSMPDQESQWVIRTQLALSQGKTPWNKKPAGTWIWLTESYWTKIKDITTVMIAF